MKFLALSNLIARFEQEIKLIPKGRGQYLKGRFIPDTQAWYFKAAIRPYRVRQGYTSGGTVEAGDMVMYVREKTTEAISGEPILGESAIGIAVNDQITATDQHGSGSGDSFIVVEKLHGLEVSDLSRYLLRRVIQKGV